VLTFSNTQKAKQAATPTAAPFKFGAISVTLPYSGDHHEAV
jgi:hypothetical protein